MHPTASRAIIPDEDSRSETVLNLEHCSTIQWPNKVDQGWSRQYVHPKALSALEELDVAAVHGRPLRTHISNCPGDGNKDPKKPPHHRASVSKLMHYE